jgi:hypothetical protein
MRASASSRKFPLAAGRFSYENPQVFSFFANLPAFGWNQQF